MEEWRIILYPLGFLSGLAFGARFIVQWIQSEKQGTSLVSPVFWQLSLIGNLLLALHAFIQVQYPICLVQACSAVISWRNLDLMQKRRLPLSFATTCRIFFSSALLVTVAFGLQGFILEESSWLRIPISPWQPLHLRTISPLWHWIGFTGYALFSSRFGVQWWLSERKQESYLPLSFWWISLIGATLSILYFTYIWDVVNLIGPLIGFIPYIRNLMLIQVKKT